MFNTIDLLIRYHLETEWFLTWFPNRVSRILTTAKSRGGVFNHVNTDFGPGLGAGTGVVHLLGQGLGPDAHGDALDESANMVHASITISVNTSNSARFFNAELEATLGAKRRRKNIILPPNTVTPFMINVQGSQNDPAFQDTTLTLHGVFNADPTIDLSVLVDDKS